ncbi:MAG TPA: LptA/OstA family protein [Bryobacteraceae bacterium]|nr:LptA/OstA family protein [Bryobacteraceae bacterium]
MRRISIFLALAAVLISAAVGYTLKLRIERARRARVQPMPAIKPGLDAISPSGWHWKKSDPETGKPIVLAEADSAQATHDPSTFEIHGLAMRLYDKQAGDYTYIKSDKALFDERSGLLRSDGPVMIVINVPADQDASNKDVVAKRVHVQTSGVIYETKTGKASTDQPASFVFTEGDGQGVGVEYDPSAKILHLKSKVALDWIGHGPAANKMHIEAGDLVYKETEQKIYLSPWSKMRRQSTVIQAQNSVVTLEEDYAETPEKAASVIPGSKKTHLHEIESDHAIGSDDRDGRHTDYSADKMTALFDEAGNLVNIIAENNARVVATQEDARTSLTGNRADLRFAVTAKETNGEPAQESNLHLVLADGNAVAESVPLPRPGVQLAETRILRSEHLELEMKPGGKEIQEIRTSTKAQLEFKPNRPDQSHRIIDASRLRVLYGKGSYVDTFLAWNAAIHTDKPTSSAKAATNANAKPGGPPPPALTWSDELKAKFTPDTNQVATVEQNGHFRYEEGVRKASADKALLEQAINKMILKGSARVSDDTGTAVADTIVMNQANGDMDATGHVFSTHQPDKSQKPGTSMLDDSKAMQAQADQMRTRDNNTVVHYRGHVVMWQGANRISSDKIDIDRDEQSLHAVGNVVSEMVDNRSDESAPAAEGTQTVADKTTPTPTSPPIFTIVRAPELNYHDDSRIALYSGGVKLTREKMTVAADEVKAFLTPKTSDNSNQSSLDHAFATGKVTVSQVLPGNRTRVGTSDRCEYYTKDSKVVLNGGAPQVVDSQKGLTKGTQLTYFSDDDHLIVEGAKKDLAYTRMKKK